MPTAALEGEMRALALLGLAPGAGRVAIRRAFRRKARACHPDLHGGLPEMERSFKELNEAYRSLMEGAGASAPPEEAGRAAPGAGMSPPAIADRRPARGRDLHFRLRLSFLQAALGGEISVRFLRPAPCPACAGGGEAGCRRCSGSGEVAERALERVRVPSGVEEGEMFRLPGGGGAGQFGGPAGDLVLLASCGSCPEMARRGLDVWSEVRLPPRCLESGGTIRVSTLHGDARGSLPPRTPPGMVLRLRGWGIRRRRGGREDAGDHFVRLEALA